MRYGFCAPVTGDAAETRWDDVRRLVQRAERAGWDLALIAGPDEAAFDAVPMAAALAAATQTLELMVAVSPHLHHPALFAGAAATVDRISGGRLSLNLAPSPSPSPGAARRYGLPSGPHDDGGARLAEWLQVVDGMWSGAESSFSGQFYATDHAVCAPRPISKPAVYAGGDGDAAQSVAALLCDGHMMNGEPVEAVAAAIAGMAARRAGARRPPMRHGMTALAIVRDSEAEARREMALRGLPASGRDLRPSLVGTPEQLAQRIADYEAAGLDLLLLRMPPQAEEIDRFAAQVIAPARARKAAA